MAGNSRADFSLGTGANYGVLVGPNIGNFHLTSDSYITGTVGVGATALNNGGTNNNLQFSGATLTGNLVLGGNNTNGTGGTVTGTITQNSTAVATAYNTISTLSSTLAGLTATTLSITGSAQTIQVTGGTNNSNTYAYTVTANNFKNYGALTINGTAGEYLVINITGNNNFNFDNAITLTGGITADHVIYNITGTGNIGAAANGATINGDIIGLNSTFNMDSVVVDGRIFGGATGADFSLVSNFRLNQPAGMMVPEPASIAMMLIGGGMAAGFVTYRRRRARAAKAIS